jgi:hypothetical protein
VLSSHFSPRFAPQVGQRTASACFPVTLMPNMMQRPFAERMVIFDQPMRRIPFRDSLRQFTKKDPTESGQAPRAPAANKYESKLALLATCSPKSAASTRKRDVWDGALGHASSSHFTAATLAFEPAKSEQKPPATQQWHP